MKAVLFLSLIFILQTFQPASSRASFEVDPLRKTCKLASESNAGVDYHFCVTSLEAAPQSRTTDARSFVFVAAELARTNFTSTKSKIEGVLHPTIGVRLNLHNDDRAALKNCSTKYAEGINDINSAVDSIWSGDLSVAEKRIGAATIGVRQCMAILAEMKLTLMLEEDNKNAVRLTNMLQILTIFVEQYMRS